MLLRTKESANVGAAARAMLNFGLTDLWLVAPRCRIDHRAYALASHAEDVLKAATVVDTLADALAGITLVAGTSARPRKAENYVVQSPRQAAARLGTGSAVLFGPEDHGLSNDELTRCQFQVVIPTADFSSLNLAQAVLVVAYEVAQATLAGVPEILSGSPGGPVRLANHHDTAFQPPASVTGGRPPATRDQMERFYRQLEETMLLIGYTDRKRKAGIMRKFRGIIDRATPDAHELAALRGLASQTSWAAKQPPSRAAAAVGAEEGNSTRVDGGPGRVDTPDEPNV